MAFLAPVVGFVAGALGLGAVGTAVAQIAVGIGVSLLANKLVGRRSSGAATAAGGQQLSLRVEPDAERQVIFGRAATAGSLVFWHLSGANNDRLHMVIALADHECTGLNSTIWVDGKAQTWNSGTGVVSGFNNKLKVRFYSGAPGQTADAALISAAGVRWTSQDVGANVCYVVVEADYDAETFPGGVPSIVFVVDGIKLYDPRKDSTVGGSGSHRWSNSATWEWTDNPAVMVYNVLRGIRPGGELLLGMHTAADAIADFTPAANACDELVPILAGGTERRYRCNLVASSFATNADVLERILATMAGELIEVGGIYRIQAGVAQAIVASLTDADLIVDRPLTVDPRRPRSELINAVSATFSDPSRSYASVPLPIRTSSADQLEDGGIRLPVNLDLAGVTSRTQAQRIMEIERRRARRQIRITATLRKKWVGLEPGDWIEFNSERRGIVARTFEIVSTSINEDLSVDVLMQETDAGVDDWVAGDEIDDQSVVDLAPAGPPIAVVTGLTLSTIIFSAGTAGVQRPGLLATWTPVTDPTVVSLILEYRRVGDATAIERQITDPTSGSYRWSDGIQGGTAYEARVRPITQPARGSNWTAWVGASATAQQVVPVAQLATSLPPELVEEIGLTPQERLELELVTAREEIQGSVTARLAEIREDLERVAATTIGNVALMSRQMEQVRRTVDGSTVTITEIKEVTDELDGRWAVIADVDGRLLGAVELATGLTTSSFRVLANNFSVSHPTEGDLTPFVVIPGQGIFLDGVFVKDGSVTAEKINALVLSAITANLGDVTAGKLRRPDNEMIVDLDNKRLRIDF